MTRDQLDAIFDQEEQATKHAVERVERRRAEFAQLRAKIDRIKAQRSCRVSARQRECLTNEEVCFLLLRPTHQ